MNDVRWTDTVYVVFQKSSSRAWWDGFCRDGFRHCWVIKPHYWPKRGLASIHSSIKIEPMAAYLDVEHWPETAAEAAQIFANDETTTAVVAVRITLPPVAPPFLGGIRTCVTIVKFAIGIRAPFVWTPKALCDYLIAHCGGTIVRANDGQDHQVDHGRREAG